MRLLVISIGLGLLLYSLRPNALPPPMLTVVGFLVLTAGVFARMLERLGLPAAAGMMVTGVLVGGSGLVPEQWIVHTRPFSDFALAWLGLSLGAGLSPAIATNKRLLLSAGALYLAPTVLAFGALFATGLPPLTAARFAMLAGFSAPLFTFNRRNPTDEAHPVHLLTTAFGLAVWGLSGLPHALPAASQNALTLAIDAAVFILGIEVGARILQSVRSDGSRAVALAIFTLLLMLFADLRQCHPLPAALFAGLGLSLRGAHKIAPVTTSPSAMLIIAFALVDFGLRLWPADFALPTQPVWTFMIVYGIAMAGGKTIGGFIAGRHMSLPLRSWLPAMPQGFLAALCFSTLSPAIFPEVPTVATMVFVGLFCVILPVATKVADWGVQKLKNGRRAARAARQAV